ncbi:HAMP domain-containing sensor histidine kinase [Desulfosporosinus sp. FKA]|uniref:sensor histidine kinase n=1 Tax=Desulfosporosinus sp. FKA TaxID=1969834 RepID=UPI000B49918E|nr:HAMP domain-containing sensor histidine kinase [Desulfosporosinus sp. FKA]
MKLSRDIMRFFIIPVVLLVGIIVTAAFTVFYTTTARTSSGKIISSNWPKEFTHDFSEYINIMNGTPTISDTGKNLLVKNDLWIQILDATGKEVCNYDKPSTVSDTYQPYELLNLYQYGVGQYSVFVSSVNAGDTAYSYLIGFPLSISKVVTYVDTDRYNSGKTLIIMIIILTILLILALTVFYNVVISKSYERIRESLGSIASRTYKPVAGHRFLREIYEGLDTLNHDIALADRQREKDTKAREEWLANITHDLKTPLAPIRGYAELLSETNTDIPFERSRKYGAIILKNTLYAEQLVNDLKLTYQLQSNMLPLKKETLNVTRFVKEVVIDILNAPDLEGRNVSFISNSEAATYFFDPLLFRRAVTNIVVNALAHNDTSTEVSISLDADSGVKLTIADNGNGMTPQELDDLFTRYFRGTSTEIKAEGSGLGMAIAKQIVEAHDGVICAESMQGVGTTITIVLP